MSLDRQKRVRLRGLTATVLAVALAVCLFLLCYRFDNKYNTATPQPRGGILLLEEETLERDPVLFLVNGWELYPGLATPEELRGDPLRSGRSVYIGQYTGFDLGVPGKSPHGSATLLLNIAVPDTARAYALELPEIYSAYSLYVNGERLIVMGDPDPGGYRPRTGNRAAMFTAAGNIEIVIAMSDYSHIYSGLVYPPAFGDPEAVQRLLAARLALRAGVAAAALGLGLFYLTLGFFLRRRGEAGGGTALLYGLLCLCLLGYTGYPVVKTLLPGALWWYALESFCYCAMLALTMLVQGRLCGCRGKAANAFPAFGAAVCACALATPLIGAGGTALRRAWSGLVALYFVLCALYLTAAAVYGLLRGGVRSRALLCGALVFDAALVTDRLLPDHEPIYTGWFTEWAGLVLVLCTGTLIVGDILRQYRLRRALEENMGGMRRLMKTQQAYYPLVLEQAEQARAARHDLRHHLAAVGDFAARGDYPGLADYLRAYGEAPEPTPVVFCSHRVLNMLLSHFAAQAGAAGVRFTAHADVPEALPYADPDLFAICANLLENALEAAGTLPVGDRWIEAGIRRVPGSLAIAVDNAFDGVVEGGSGGLASRKRPGRAGIGTASVRRIAERYGGSAAYHWEQTERGGVFHAGVILPMECSMQREDADD